MESKKCFKCKSEKPLKDFYKHPKTADGHLNKCKICTRKDSNSNYNLKKEKDPSFLESERKRTRERYYRLGYKNKFKPSPERKRQIINNHKKKYPEKYKAKCASQSIKKKDSQNQLHHWSYNQRHWKDVIELSIEDHNYLHRQINYDQELMMYRDSKGNLLDTKESHLEILYKSNRIAS